MKFANLWNYDLEMIFFFFGKINQGLLVQLVYHSALTKETNENWRHKVQQFDLYRIPTG